MAKQVVRHKMKRVLERKRESRLMLLFLIHDNIKRNGIVQARETFDRFADADKWDAAVVWWRDNETYLLGQKKIPRIRPRQDGKEKR